MSIQEIANKFTNSPSYLKKGPGVLASMFNCTVDDIEAAKLLLSVQVKEEIRTSVNVEAGTMKSEVTTVKDVVSPDEFYDMLKVSRDEYTISSFYSIVRNNNYKGYTVLWKKKNPTEIDLRKQFEDFLSTYQIPSSQIDSEREEHEEVETSQCSVLCLFDAHFGKSPNVSSGQPRMTLNQQKEYFLEVVTYLCEVMDRKVNTIVFPIGNDFLNCEATGATTKGTKQQNTPDINLMFKVGLETITEAIGIIKNYCNTVHLLHVPGNHDHYITSMLSMAVEKLYEKDPNVTLDMDSKPRKIFTHGKVLIGFGHGILPMKEYATLLPVEYPKEYGQSTYREIFLGDKHTEKSEEFRGTLVRHLGALTPNDDWHEQSGYVGNLKRAYNIIYDENYKLTEFYHVD